MADTTAIPERQTDFVLRRLMSLTGVIPIGVFLIVHLTTNVMVVFNTADKDEFQAKVNLIHGLGPLLIPVEIFGILLPIAFHAAIGLKIWLEGKSNASVYRYGANIRYSLQRWTGIIALIFIIVHLWQMHWVGAPFGGARFDPDEASVTTARTLQESRWWASPLYGIGIVAVCYHFANGLWTFMITWGITVKRNAQKKAGYVCAVLGIALACTGLAAMNGFMEYPVPAEAQTESSVAPAEPGAEAGEGG